MADPCNVPKDILESMRDVLDKRVKISIRRMVKMEIKADKLDNRILAFSPCRLFILTARSPTKVDASFHFLDIQALESKKPGQLVLTIDNKEYKFMATDAGSDVMDHLIMHFALSLKQIFPSFPLERLIVKVDILPEDRMKKMQDLVKAMESKDVGPCGGFTTMYQCMCDFHSLPYREEVAWDVDTIYLSHDSRELRLQDFDHLPHKDLIPVIAALEHNTWFKSFNASAVKLSVETCNEVIKVMRRNAVLEEISLRNTGIKTDFVQKLSTALISNSGSQLQVIDLSYNLLEDKAISHLMGALKTLTCGVSSLDLSNTGISTRCINKLGEALAQNPSALTSLTCLKLNDNGLKGEDFPMLYTCLAHPNSITTLDLSSTDCVLDSLCDPLLRGCPSLITLKLSKTLFTHKRSKEVLIPQSWKQLFASCCCLENIDLSSCKFPPEALKELLLGVASNRYLKELHLDISSNELGSSGVSVLTSCFPDIRCIRSLDISNNGFDLDMKTLLPELGKNTNLKQLSIGRNFSNIKPKYMVDVMNSLVTALLLEESALESLSVADSRLRMDTTYIFNALGSNNTLVELDIGGNGIGDLGARMLGKALLINTKLRRVVWDKNQISAPGFEDVAEALKRNMSLKKMPFPVNDASASMRLYPDRTEAALQKIESLLQRNHCPGRFAPDNAYRLQQGFLISATQQILDRKVVQLQDSIQALNNLGSMDVYAGDVATAESLVKDADKSRQLLPGLQHIALVSQSPGNVVDQQLETTTTNLRETIEGQLKNTREAMLKHTLEQCPTIMGKETFQGNLEEGCFQKTSLPKDFTKGVLEGAATDIYNLTGELNLAVASLISDTVINEVIESLSASHKTLANHMSLRKSGVYKENIDESTEDSPKISAEASPQLSNKRNSMWNRKTRPQSTMERERRRSSLPDEERTEEALYQNLRILSGQEALSIASSWQVQEKLQDISQESTPTGSTEMLDGFGDLPLTSSKPLTHVTKSRPRPPKSSRPTKPILNTGTTEMDATTGSTNSSAFPSSPTPPRPEVTVPSERKTSKDETPPTPSKSDQGKTAKQEEGGGSKSESKKWSPMSFIKGKNKEEKPEKLEKDKKSHSFSAGISNIFKKKEDKKRPSLSEATASAADSNDSKKVFTDSKELETSVEVVKEEESSTKDVFSSSTKSLPERPSAPKDVNPIPVRPPREKSERSAILPPKEKKESKVPTLAKAEDSTLEDEVVNKKDNSQEGTRGDVEGEKKETPADVPTTSSGPKLPPGAVKMGGLTALGNKNLLDQLKMKQVKRKSHMDTSPEEKKDTPERVSPSPPVETNNNNDKTDSNISEQSSKENETDSSEKETPSSSQETLTVSSETDKDKTEPSSPSPSINSKPAVADSKPAVPPAGVKLPAPAPRVMLPPKRPASVVVASSSTSSTTTNSTPPTSSSSESTGEQKDLRTERPLSTGPIPQARPRPPPPLKPRPPIMPRPKKRDSEIEDNPDPVTPVEPEMPPSSLSSPTQEPHRDSIKNPTGSSEPPPSDQSQDGGGIVYDSATLRLSVKDKIKRISQAKALGPDAPAGGLAAIQQAKKKAASLPREAPVPELAKEDLTTEHSRKDDDATDSKTEADQDWVVVQGNEAEDDGTGGANSSDKLEGPSKTEEDKRKAADDDNDDTDDVGDRTSKLSADEIMV